MKTNSLFRTLLLLLLCSISFVSCNTYLLDEKKDNEEEQPEEEWYNFIPDGNKFSRANTLRFYYLDENGNDLIAPNDLKTYPVSWSEELVNPLERTYDNIADADYNTIRYNGNHNWIYYDNQEQLYYCTMTAYGDAKQSSFSFPVYVQGDTDRIDITYKYTVKGVIGGEYWGKIVSWQYNGTHVYSDDDEHDKKVFIKKHDGKTIVSLTR